MVFVNILGVIVHCAPGAQQNTVSEFNCGKRFVAAGVRLRIEPYYNQPLRSLSIGHWDVRKAQAGLAISYAQHNHMLCAHPVAETLFSAGHGGLLPDCLAVMRGEGFESWAAGFAAGAIRKPQTATMRKVFGVRCMQAQVQGESPAARS